MSTKPLFFPRLRRRSKYSRQMKYNQYRAEIREDCRFRCVYCDTHEAELRDERMELDHFRPKSLFRHLEVVPENLVLSCPVCNRKKDDDWPAYGKPNDPCIDGKSGYIDPFAEDRSEYFDILNDGSLKPIKHPAEYMIRTLFLNRPNAKSIRRKRRLIYQYMYEIYAFFDREITRLEFELSDPNLTQENRNDKKSRLAHLSSTRIAVDGLNKLLDPDGN
jgi:uncharacterized protein (TIGR02646 family)